MSHNLVKMRCYFHYSYSAFFLYKILTVNCEKRGNNIAFGFTVCNFKLMKNVFFNLDPEKISFGAFRQDSRSAQCSQQRNYLSSKWRQNFCQSRPKECSIMTSLILLFSRSRKWRLLFCLAIHFLKTNIFT